MNKCQSSFVLVVGLAAALLAASGRSDRALAAQTTEIGKVTKGHVVPRAGDGYPRGPTQGRSERIGNRRR